MMKQLIKLLNNKFSCLRGYYMLISLGHVVMDGVDVTRVWGWGEDQEDSEGELDRVYGKRGNRAAGNG